MKWIVDFVLVLLLGEKALSLYLYLTLLFILFLPALILAALLHIGIIGFLVVWFVLSLVLYKAADRVARALIDAARKLL